MAETEKIAAMAEKISSEIFEVFLWKSRGPVDSSWKCAQKQIHGVEKHPADIVFWYDEPYRNTRSYIQTDLKSYKSTSIGKSQVESALVSLAKQISCADISEEYQQRYMHQRVTPEVVGLLFIYNHDGNYDQNFGDILKKVSIESLNIPKNRRLFVLGPAEIFWLHNVSFDIQWLRGRTKAPMLPEENLCTFFYPQMIEHKQIRGETQCAATLEVLTGPWIILSYRGGNRQGSGFIVYLKGRNNTVDDFLYLFDYMRRYGMLHETLSVDIRFIDKDTTNPLQFESAQQQYAEQIAQSIDGAESLASLVRAITITAMHHVMPAFSETTVGMENA